MKHYLFFDHASTTKCCESAVELIRKFAVDDFGNPSSNHALGQQAARAIRDARIHFSEVFGVYPEQIVFTGSGSEADNLAVYGIALDALAKSRTRSFVEPVRVIVSAIEHPAVRKTAQSLSSLGVDVQFAPVDSEGQIDRERLLNLVTPETKLVSIQQVNNIVGSILPVEDLARLVKSKVPNLIFHTDAVQAYGRVKTLTSPSPIDLVSISGHKIQGPKGVGALIVLNKKLLQAGLRPLIWGGEQEGGFRSGTQNAGLIAGFHVASSQMIESQKQYMEHTGLLRSLLHELLLKRNLLKPDHLGILRWNSPKTAVPYIVSLSIPGYPSAPLAKLLEERGCLISTGSACSSQKTEPDPVLTAMGLPPTLTQSAIRISFSFSNQTQDIEFLVSAIDESIRLMTQLLGGKH